MSDFIIKKLIYEIGIYIFRSFFIYYIKETCLPEFKTLDLYSAFF